MIVKLVLLTKKNEGRRGSPHPGAQSFDQRLADVNRDRVFLLQQFIQRQRTDETLIDDSKLNPFCAVFLRRKKIFCFFIACLSIEMP
jgi:hypothetical protein